MMLFKSLLLAVSLLTSAARYHCNFKTDLCGWESDTWHHFATTEPRSVRQTKVSPSTPQYLAEHFALSKIGESDEGISVIRSPVIRLDNGALVCVTFHYFISGKTELTFLRYGVGENPSSRLPDLSIGKEIWSKHQIEFKRSSATALFEFRSRRSGYAAIFGFDVRIGECRNVVGDIRLPYAAGKMAFPKAAGTQSLRWPNNLIPYEIASSFSTREREYIYLAMEYISLKSCISFQPKTGLRHYVRIEGSDEGCYASIGFDGRLLITDPVIVNLGADCFYANWEPSTTVHELLHIIGFEHEHSRPDRDNHVQIITDNIAIENWNQFEKLSAIESDPYNSTYDYGSIMHYGRFDFAIDEMQPTIVSVPPGVTAFGGEMMTNSDVAQLNAMYECAGQTGATIRGGVGDTTGVTAGSKLWTSCLLLTLFAISSTV